MNDFCAIMNFKHQLYLFCSYKTEKFKIDKKNSAGSSEAHDTELRCSEYCTCSQLVVGLFLSLLWWEFVCCIAGFHLYHRVGSN